MDAHHLHLAMTHVPLMALLFALPILLFGLFLRQRAVQTVGLLLAVVAGIGASIVYLTGEAAEHTVEGLAGVSEVVLERHEDFAAVFLTTSLIVAAFAGATLLLRLRSSRNWPAWSTAGAILLCLGIGLVTANTGGAVRRPELRGDTTTVKSSTATPTEHRDHDYDD